MSLITTKNAETVDQGNLDQVQSVKPVGEVTAAEADHFSQLMNKEEQPVNEEVKDPKDEITLEDLQQQFRESTFRTGFNRTIEKAKEIAKEMKD
ncbi:hypothetical protein [Endozoicomonas sp. Mp262]|uniref:hypothetical protein n=1 Tax=Endozoicomonas sp. Mp262 TaxID=2919499 RepID=UPI0021DFA718